MLYLAFCIFFFFNDTATTEIYTLSLHDALPILTGEPGSAAPSNVTVCSTGSRLVQRTACPAEMVMASPANFTAVMLTSRSEEHTSELQSQSNLVCRLLLEKKKQTRRYGLHAAHT